MTEELDWEREHRERQDMFRTMGLCNDIEKACSDPFDYALGLKNGTIFRFVSAHLDGEWLHLSGDSNIHEHNIPALVNAAGQQEQRYNFERGVSVRLSEIAWIADAPMGS